MSAFSKMPLGDPQMRSSLVGRLLARVFHRLPLKNAAFQLALRVEGGQMYSLSARRILREEYGVTVGHFSYGSLMELGRADRGTDIGPYVSIGPGVSRFGAAHPKESLTLHPLWYNPALGFIDNVADVERTAIEIGADAWIGANVTILPTCRRIGIGAIVGAGSVVTKDVADFSVCVGNPAREIGQRLEPEVRVQLKLTKPWENTPTVMHAALAQLEQRRSNLE